MAAIRSHIVSLFNNGGIFPDKRWWLSCFCLPRSKEEKPVRRPLESSEKVIYTIQLNEDEQSMLDFDLAPSIENSSSSVTKTKHTSDHLLTEIPLANGCQVLLSEGLILATPSRHMQLNEHHTEEYTATLNEHEDDYLTSLPNVEVKSDNCVLSSEAFININLPERDSSVLTNESALDEKESSKVALAVTQSVSDLHQLFTITANDPIQDAVPAEKHLISVDTSKPLVDLTDESLVDFSKISSDLETSGIQSNSVNCEDATLHLSSSCDNSYESIDDSDVNIQLTGSFLTSSPTTDGRTDSLKNDVYENCQNNNPERPVFLEVENENLLMQTDKRSSYSDCLLGLDSSESVTESELQIVQAEPSVFHISKASSVTFSNYNGGPVFDEKTCTERCSERVPNNLVQLSDHDYFKELSDTQECEEYDSDRVCCNDWSSQKNSVDHNQDFCDAGHKSSTGLIGLNTCIVENTTMKPEFCDEVIVKSIFRVKDVKETNVEEKDSSWNIEDLIEGDIAGGSSLLQVKLLFRSDSYEMLEIIAKELAFSLLDDALAQLLPIKDKKRFDFTFSDNNCFLARHQQSTSHDDIDDRSNHLMNNSELTLMNEGEDPFLISDANALEEVLIDNYEQLFDTEEWLDDDFGFSFTYEAKPPPPYPDAINDKYSSIIVASSNPENDGKCVFVDLSVIHLIPEKIFPIIDQAVDVFWSSRRYGESWNEVHPPETYFDPEDLSDTLEDCSRKSHKTFVFDLVAEILQEIYCDELFEIPFPWLLVNGTRSKYNKESPTTVEVLKPIVRNRVLQSLRLKEECSSERMRKCMTMRRQGDNKDFVDKILINEMYLEEPGWTDYSKDANFIKNHVANKLFFSLIKDTAMVLKLLHNSYGTNCG